jgi:hypothetical protein
MAMILNGPHIVSQPQENEPPPSSCVGRWCSRRMADPWRIAVHESGHCVAAQLYYGTEQERKAAEEQRKQLDCNSGSRADAPPKYTDLDLLLGAAKEATKHASLAVEGLKTDLDDLSQSPT